MDMSQHNMENLFMQLGLESNEEAIEDFMADHTLQEDEKLEDASFWSASQAAVIKECLASVTPVMFLYRNMFDGLTLNRFYVQ